MDCQKEKNLSICRCTYFKCSRRGICCQCLQHHLAKRELPGCCFPEKSEATYDRSFEHFVKLVQEGKV